MTTSLTRPTTRHIEPLAPAKVWLAVLRALTYSDIFDYAPSADELYTTLETPHISPALFEQTLAALLDDGKILSQEGRYMLAGREALAAIWQHRQQHSARKWRQARRFTRLIRCLPFIRMVAITGTLAVNSAEEGDDIDLFLITAPGRVWLARALTIVVVRLAVRFGVTLCPNYLVATNALALSERNLYTARELAQMQPLYGAAWYQQLRASNRWTLAYLPNAQISPLPKPLRLDRLPWLARLGKGLGERLLGGRLGTALDHWEMRRKAPRLLKARAPVAPEEVSFSPAQCKGHFEGHATRILQVFDERVAALRGDEA